MAICSPNALAGSGGTDSIPSKVSVPLFPQCPGRALGEPGAPWVLSSLNGHDPLFPPCPGRALGEYSVPWVLSILRLCFPNTLAEHWKNKGPLGLYLAGSSQLVSACLC